MALINAIRAQLGIAALAGLLITTGGVSASAYLSPGDRHKVVAESPAQSALITARGGTLIGDYGSFQWYEVGAEAFTGPDSISVSLIRDTANVLELNSGHVDTTAPRLHALPPTDDSFSGKRLHLVHFAGPVQPEWHESLLNAGVQVVCYIPNNAYLVYGDAKSIQSLRSATASRSYVQWFGSFPAEWKISASSTRSVPNGKTSPIEESRDFAVQMVRDKETNSGTVALIDSLKVEAVRRPFEQGPYLNAVARLRPRDIKQIANRPDVISIQPYERPRLLDERQNQIVAGAVTEAGQLTGTGYLSWLTSVGFTQQQFTESGFVVDIADSGIDVGTTTPNHAGLYTGGSKAQPSRVAYARLEGTANSGSTIKGCDGHGTLNAHIVGGFDNLSTYPHRDTAGYQYGLGVAPFVKIGSSTIFDPESFTDPDYENMLSRAYRDGARITSNSWGGGSGGQYTIDSQAYDALVRDAQPAGSSVPMGGNQEMVVVFAAGNAGPNDQTVGAPGTGKNVISVGGSENVRAFGAVDGCGVPDTQADNANDIADFSSRGPCADGRIKPDIVAPSTHITGGVIQTATAGSTGQADSCFNASGICGGINSGIFYPTGQQLFSASSGTSHSTPAVAGGAALVRQYFTNKGWNTPSPAMTKALLMTSARYMKGIGANDNLPSKSQGMGTMDLSSAFSTDARILRDQLPEDTLTATGQTRRFTGVISNPSQPFRVTLAYTDAPGSTTSSAWNNNLDLTVISGGREYKGNVFVGGWSQTGGTADHRNNVESVFLPAGASGPFAIIVTAQNINSDGVPNWGGSLDQDFALVVTNAQAIDTPVPTTAGFTIANEGCSPANASADPEEQVIIDFGLRNVGTRETTDLVATLEASGGITPLTTSMSYGVIHNTGEPVTRGFALVAHGECGSFVTARLTLKDGDTDLGVAEYRFRLGALVTPVNGTYRSSNPLAIVDAGTISQSIAVPHNGVVAGVTVKARIRHNYISDLKLTLVAPDGTSAVLCDKAGDAGMDMGSGAEGVIQFTEFTDTASQSITFGTAPFAGSYRPVEPLSIFNDIPVSGNWTLIVTDQFAPDTGALLAWELGITRLHNACCGIVPAPDVEVGQPAIVMETCSPGNLLPDEGETITLRLPLTNAGPGPTTALTATLLPDPTITIAGDATQNYGILQPGGTPVNALFTCTVNAACGSKVRLAWQIKDGAKELGIFPFDLTVGSLGAMITTVHSSSGAVGIPDAGQIERSLAVSAPGVIEDIQVRVRANHTWVGDLTLTLIAPDGTVIPLFNGYGGSGDNLGSGATNCTGFMTTFDETSQVRIWEDSAPFRGSYRPEQSLSLLRGKTAAGTWKLRIRDGYAGDTGVLYCWELVMTRRHTICCGSAGVPELVYDSGQLVAESCVPANGNPDSGESVVYSIGLRNLGSASAGDLLVSVQPSANVMPLSGSRNYGPLAPEAPIVYRDFQFICTGTCGATVPVVLSVTDGTRTYQPVNLNLRIGAQTITTSSPANTSSITIVDDSVASPYPSNIAVSGLTGTITKVTATLKGFRHTYPNDTEIVLIGPTGQSCVLMAWAGGYTSVTGLNLTFDDDAATSLGNGALVSGTFRPSNLGFSSNLPLPAPVSPYGDRLGGFIGTNPNGTWRLYVNDSSYGDSGAITGGWSLDITTALPSCCSSAATFTLLDALQAIRIAGGLLTSSASDVTKLNIETEEPSVGLIDLVDASRIIRKAAGLD